MALRLHTEEEKQAWPGADNLPIPNQTKLYHLYGIPYHIIPYRTIPYQGRTTFPYETKPYKTVPHNLPKRSKLDSDWGKVSIWVRADKTPT